VKKSHSLLYHVIVFVVTQLVWLSLLGLWIYWYVYNYIVFEKVGDQVSPYISYNITNVVPFVIGLVLLIGLSFTTSVIFRNLNVQLRLTKLYDNFIGNVTHELKSPLSSIQLHLETLKTRNIPPEKQEEFINLMMRDAQRLKNLIDSILGLLAVEQKKLIHDHEVCDATSTLKKIINDSLEQFRLPPSTYKIEIGSSSEIVIDKNAMKIVFNNLIDNAIKYSVQEVQLNVKIGSNSNKVIIEFIDNGIGLLPKEQKKIFNKFYRIYHQDIPSVKGTGLGLYWVKEIIKSHGGKISVYSEGTGKGSRFTIELPVYKASEKRFVNKLLKNSKDKKPKAIADA
jgi:two-component system phosphate regulon sensor histidine kinase PhoR